MKNLFKFLTLGVLAAFIALGCSNTSGDAVSLGDGTASGKTALKTITLVATGDAEAIKFPTKAADGISASIVAGTIQADSLKYYLFITNKITGAVTNPTESLSFTASAASPNVGTVPLSIADGFYLFKLYATNATVATPTEENVKSGALFLGQTEADLRSSTDTVTFYLTSDTLTGSADVAIKLMTTGWTVPTGYAISAGITKKTDGSVVGGASLADIASVTDTDPATAQFNQSGVTAGTYNFEVRFSNASTGKEYVWSDTIIVAPNHNIAQTVKIPEVIDLPPAAPTDFNATFKDPDTTSAETYNVEFTWKADDSVNESYFQIDLLEVPVGAQWTDINADTSTEWTEAYRTTLGNNSTTFLTSLGKEFYGNELQKWVDGSLRKNNTKAVVELPLGKRYLARIAAVNDAGPSGYCYVDFDNANVPATLTTGYNKFAADSKVINRYRLTYNLLGGTVTLADDTTSVKDIVEYRTQNTVANGTAGSYVAAAITSNIDVPTADIWNPSTDTSTYKSLVKGSKAWTAWRRDSSASATLYDTTPSSSPYNPPDYQDFVNLVLYASYSPTNAAVNILDDNDWTISIANFTVAGTGVTDTNLAAKSEIALDLATTGAGNVTWTGTYTSNQTDAGVKWSKVTYTIQKTGVTSSVAGPKDCAMSETGFSTTTELGSYQEGKYLIKFNAYAPHKTEPYTQTIVINITSN